MRSTQHTYAMAATLRTLNDLLSIRKIHFDGVNEINTAAVLEDFANEPGNKVG